MSHKAILVKYLPFTNHKPARVKAIVHRSLSITVSVSEYGSNDEARLAAAKSLAESLSGKGMGWRGKYIKGTLPNGDTVFIDEDTLDPFGSFTL